jgi:hypothetical protein
MASVVGDRYKHQYLQILSECLPDIIGKYGMDKKKCHIPI